MMTRSPGMKIMVQKVLPLALSQLLQMELIQFLLSMLTVMVILMFYLLHYLDDKIAWYENNGSQTFSSNTITTNTDYALWVYATDVDNDGDIDVLVSIQKR